MRFCGAFSISVCLCLLVAQRAYAAAPSITTQPQPPSQSILAGSNVTYSVVASGTAPLSYQWSLNGTNLANSAHIAGAISATLTVSNLVATDDGSYQVVVSNRNGTATSSNATLTVLVPATITGQPQSLTTNGGSTVTLSATVSGSTPLFYQWQFNGTNLAGATNATLTLSNVLDNQSGAYDLVVSNNWGVATSSNATLTVIPWIIPSISPNPITYGTGQLLIWALNTGGFSPDATYQWYQNGNTMGSFWLFTDAAEVAEWRDPPPSVAGDYYIVASDSLNTVTSSVVTLTVLVPATITTPPANQAVAVSSNVVFAAVVIGDAPVSYKWYFNGTLLSDGGRISGSTTATLNIASAQTNDAGSYLLVVSNIYGSANATAALSVLFPPAITSQPTNQLVALGSNVTFMAAATGSSPLSYQWFFNGNALTDGGQFSGSATPNLTISNLQLTNAGNYALVVTNLVGSVTSAVATLSLHGVTRYVDVNGTNSISPYLSWSTAATNIQDAIDASTDGDLILVTNGIYQAGGRVVFGAMTNVVAITKAVTVQSVNGPGVTTIHNQYWYYYSEATRDVYMTNNSALIGFTINSGTTRTNGDTMKEESGGGIYCEDNSSVISNCVISGNSAWMNGGGVVGGTLYNCTLSGNAASKVASNGYGAGGGAINSILNDCVITGNTAQQGAGAANSTLNFCTVSGNTATGPYADYFISFGGGVLNGVANNCKFIGNSAYVGGAFYGYPSGTLNNCLVVSNSAGYGGGTYDGVMNNCTIVANSSGNGAGAYYGTLNNCIVYDNNGSNSLDSALNYCCTFPMPTNGVGNFTNDPVFVNPTNEFHLMPNSPCIGTGKNAYAVGSSDLDGNARIVNGTVDVGAYEYQYLPIFVITQPANQANTIGQSVSFSVVATGNPQLSYQWQFNGANIAGATNSSVTLTNIQLNQAGLYSVILSNSVTNLSSSNATLTVNYPAPVIVSQPTNVLVFAGSSVSFSASVLTYSSTTNQWMFNNTTPLIDDGRIVGSTTTNLTIANVQTNDAGTYSLVASNAYGYASSANATLTVYPLTTISFPQGNVNANGGTNVTINTVITGQAPFSYQWQYNGGILPGATNSFLTISNVLDVQAGNYAIAVSNAAGTVLSSNVSVTVTPYVNATVWPGTVIAGSPGYASFWLNEGGFASNAVYQWFHNGTNMGPAWAWTATNTTASFQPLMADAGTYYVFASDGVATATSTNEVLIVIPLAIATQPTNQSALAGGTVTIGAVAQGQAPVALQWQFDGTNISGATNASLVLTNVQLDQAGIYTLLASNAFTNLVSSNAMLTVAPLGITHQPSNYIAWPNGSATFQVTVAGQGPFGYDWQLNGNDLGAPSTNVLAVTNIQTGQFGNYDVVVSNQYGSITSSVASLIFSQVAVWGVNTYGETNLTTGLTNIVAISGGDTGNFDCVALKNTGTPVAWPGTLSPQQTNGATNLIAISGALPTYALRSNGTVVEWYSDGAIALGGVTNIAAIAFGPPSYFLALRADGRVPQLQASSPSNVVAIAEGNAFSLMLKSDGTIAATGNNPYGQTTVPTGLSNVVAVAAGANHSLALKGNGTVVGWGLNATGQVTIPLGLSNVVAIAAGATHSLALKADGTVVAWGNNGNGQTNVPRGLTNVVAIAGAPAFSMALIGNGPPTTHALLSNPLLGTNGASFTISSQSGRVYVLQYKNSLTDSNWTSLPLVPGTGGTITLRDSTATNGGRFYRVQRW